MKTIEVLESRNTDSGKWVAVNGRCMRYALTDEGKLSNTISQSVNPDNMDAALFMLRMRLRTLGDCRCNLRWDYLFRDGQFELYYHPRNDKVWDHYLPLEVSYLTSRIHCPNPLTWILE